MIVLLSLLVSFVCISIRSAFSAVERTRVEERAAQGQPRAVVLLHLLDSPPHSLAPVDALNIGALLTLVASAAWRSLEAGPQLGPLLANLVYLLAIWLVGFLCFFYWSSSRALRISELSAPLVAGLDAIARPFVSLTGWLVRRAKGVPRTSDRVTSDDFQIIVTEGNQERKLEEIEPEEREMIAGIIEMSERTARDLMIPRLDVIAMDVGATLDEALDTGVKYGHSRLPVFEGDVDHIVGILHVKDLIQAIRHPQEVAGLKQLLRPVHYVPDTAKADALLRDLLRNRVHMAVVVDEYGGTVGIVTIEDALEEIVGEIRDEYDAAEEPEYVRLNDQAAVFAGRVPIAEVNDVLGTQLPTEETDTLGGLVYSLLGRMPRQGDKVQVNSAELQVTAVSGRRIKKVQVNKIQPAPESPAGAPPAAEREEG